MLFRNAAARQFRARPVAGEELGACLGQGGDERAAGPGDRDAAARHDHSAVSVRTSALAGAGR